MIGGIFFGASMYFFNFKSHSSQSFSKPIRYASKSTEKKLLAFEATLEEPLTKYIGLTSFSFHRKITIVPVNIYMFAEYMIFSTYVQREIKVIKETYDNIRDIVKGEDQVINITFADNSALFISLHNDEDVEQLLGDFQIKKNWYGVA
jgi:hypothetical protein